jgi:hypothetical protein
MFMFNGIEENLSERPNMTVDERLAQLKKNLCNINTLAFPSYHVDKYNQLISNRLIRKIKQYATADNVSNECDLVTIGWLVMAFYMAKHDYVDLKNHTSYMDAVSVSDEFKLFLTALEIGTRMINGEGEANSFGSSEFSYEYYIGLLDDFHKNTQNKAAYSDVQSLIRCINFLVKKPEYTDRMETSPLYKSSTILAKLRPTGYSAIKVILNQAINAVNIPYILWEPEVEYKTKVRDFKSALYELKSEVLTMYRNKRCDEPSARAIADLALGLAQKIEKKIITQDDIDSFTEATNQYRTTATMSAKLNQLIYAGVAVLTILAAVTSVIAGAGVVGAVLATAVGVGIGLGAARYTIWQNNKTMVEKLDSLEETARPCM